jgi:hypothetical protein
MGTDEWSDLPKRICNKYKPEKEEGCWRRLNLPEQVQLKLVS